MQALASFDRIPIHRLDFIPVQGAITVVAALLQGKVALFFSLPDLAVEDRILLSQAPAKEHPPMRQARGFTLIELLVVITIIVVLLALLSPALDQGVYHAELAVCGATFRGLASAATLYASDHKRIWPHRTENYNWDALTIRMPPLLAQAPPYDLRATIAPYAAADMFLDPLCAGIDLGDAANRDDTVMYSNGNVFFGWGVSGHRYMRKMGDRFTWIDPAGRTHRFNVLAADRDSYYDGNHAVTSHPDDEGKLEFITSQAQPVTNYSSTHSHWQRMVWDGDHTRGKIDASYAFDDGSVLRIVGVAMSDSRLVEMPTYTDGYYAAGYKTQLPAEH